MQTSNAFALSVALIIASLVLGLSLNKAVTTFKAGERSVVVKGLSEKEVQADVMVLPIRFTRVNNDLNTLYQNLNKDTQNIVSFLENLGITREDITITPVNVKDKLSDAYGDNRNIVYRYTGSAGVLLYTKNIASGMEALQNITQLGTKDIILQIENYETEYLYTGLNAIKPQMIEEATLNAREAAEKFAKDSKSTLGKIKRASQGQFSITNRDANTPHIKNVRVVSTIEYYLED